MPIAVEPTPRAGPPWLLARPDGMVAGLTLDPAAGLDLAEIARHIASDPAGCAAVEMRILLATAPGGRVRYVRAELLLRHDPLLAARAAVARGGSGPAILAVTERVARRLAGAGVTNHLLTQAEVTATTPGPARRLRGRVDEARLAQVITGLAAPRPAQTQLPTIPAQATLSLTIDLRRPRPRPMVIVHLAGPAAPDHLGRSRPAAPVAHGGLPTDRAGALLTSRRQPDVAGLPGIPALPPAGPASALFAPSHAVRAGMVGAVADWVPLLRRLADDGCAVTVVTDTPASWAGAGDVAVVERVTGWGRGTARAPRLLVVDRPDPPPPAFATAPWTCVAHLVRTASEAGTRDTWDVVLTSASPGSRSSARIG